MKRRFCSYQRKNASVAATVSWSVRTASSEFGTTKPKSLTETPAWNAAPVLKTAPPTPSMLIPMTAAAVLPISSTAGLPGCGTNRPLTAAAEF